MVTRARVQCSVQFSVPASRRTLFFRLLSELLYLVRIVILNWFKVSLTWPRRRFKPGDKLFVKSAPAVTNQSITIFIVLKGKTCIFYRFKMVIKQKHDKIKIYWPRGYAQLYIHSWSSFSTLDNCYMSASDMPRWEEMWYLSIKYKFIYSNSWPKKTNRQRRESMYISELTDWLAISRLRRLRLRYGGGREKRRPRRKCYPRAVHTQTDFGLAAAASQFDLLWFSYPGHRIIM